MHQMGCPDHLATESLADCLMAKADTENGYAVLGLVDEFEADAGLIGGTRSRRQNDRLRSGREHLADTDLVIAMDDRLGAEIPQEMIQVPGEAVVVVDEDDHCPLPARPAKRTASSAARNSAFALLTHSMCSDLGTLSATRPAPACTYILPSLTMAVLSMMHVSMSPSAEK